MCPYKKKAAELERQIQELQLRLEILFEFACSVAHKEGVSLLSYQQLHSPSPKRARKVRMLLKEIRKLR